MTTVKTIDQVKAEMSSLDSRLVQYYDFRANENGVHIRRNAALIRCTSTSYGGNDGLYELTHLVPESGAQVRDLILKQMQKVTPLGWQPIANVIALTEWTAVYLGETSALDREDLFEYIQDNFSRMIDCHNRKKKEPSRRVPSRA